MLSPQSPHRRPFGVSQELWRLWVEGFEPLLTAKYRGDGSAQRLLTRAAVGLHLRHFGHAGRD